MENKNVNQVEETTQNASEEAVVQETSGPRKVYKDQDFYPVCAIIMCVCAAVGQLIDPDLGLTIGMFIGIVAAIVYVAKGGKQIDTSPTKVKEKKDKK